MQRNGFPMVSPPGDWIARKGGTAMPYEKERGGLVKWLALLLTLLLVGGAIYWGMASSS